MKVSMRDNFLSLKLTGLKNPYAKIRLLSVRKATTTSRCLIQKSFKKSIQLEIEHDVVQLRISAFQKIIIPISRLTYLLRYTNEDFFSKGNDVKLFHLFFTVFHMINYARIIEDLISNKRSEKFLLEPKIRLNLKTDPHESKKPISDLLIQISCFFIHSTQCFRTRLIVVSSFTIRPLRNINQRTRQNQFRERRNVTNLIRKNHQKINNEDTLNRISNLPPQPITNDPLIDQFFNGSSFNLP
ncbi:hypothetical protein GLOIN_2v1471937 [Rhizophagus clarus]|uniref:Uncharacterized protein n=1 Tax=Rhizophagus clarus TaxID=94130 RepID=A0A8H3M5G0_9GLOM|nr:hypothetical protein GLOIN_2v1471937 [Rhizophagus clarus]